MTLIRGGRGFMMTLLIFIVPPVSVRWTRKSEHASSGKSGCVQSHLVDEHGTIDGLDLLGVRPGKLTRWCQYTSFRVESRRTGFKSVLVIC